MLDHQSMKLLIRSAVISDHGQSDLTSHAPASLQNDRQYLPPSSEGFADWSVSDVFQNYKVYPFSRQLYKFHITEWLWHIIEFQKFRIML